MWSGGRIHLPEMTFQFHVHTPGGVGYSRKMFGLHEQLLAASLEVIRGCGCVQGCPSSAGAGIAGFLFT
jgi:DEAD/DEAH box helicase domain-containing protein